MTESWIEIVRRRIREGEERLRRVASGISRVEAPIPKQDDPPVTALVARPSEGATILKTEGGGVQSVLQQSFEALLPLLKESFILVDEEGTWKLANPHLSSWLGYTPEQFKGINLTEIFAPQDLKILLSTSSKWFSGNEPIVRLPCSLRNLKGRLFPVLLSSHAWKDLTGKRFAYLIFEEVRTPRKRKQATGAGVEPARHAAIPGGDEEKYAMASREWQAYGQMAQGRMKQLSHFIAASVCDIADQIRSRQSIWAAEPAFTRLLQTIDRTRRTLAQWQESAQSLALPARGLRMADLLGTALAARKPELERWGVEAVVQGSEAPFEDGLCPPELFAAALHILQACIEELRESKGGRRLGIRAQSAGERLEVVFVYEIPGRKTVGKHSPGESASLDFRSTSMELRAAQKLLEAIGCTLVLENLVPHQRAIRMRLNPGILAAVNSDRPIEKEEGAN
jgi:PAS domain S-box-containing protein